MSKKSLNQFSEFANNDQYPSIKDSIGLIPYEGKDDIVKYLRSGKVGAVATSYAYDIFTGERIPGEKCIMTDGEYSWGSYLAYYVEKYNLRLLPEFEKKVLKIA